MEILTNNADLIILILMLIVGIGIAFFNTVLIIKEQKATNWLEVDGRITKSEIGISQSFTKESYDNYYRAEIKYEYELGGKCFISDQAYFGDKIYLSYKNKAVKILKMFPIRQRVSVFVNPNNHSESILVKSSIVNRSVNIFIGFVVGVVGFLLYSNYELIYRTLTGNK